MSRLINYCFALSLGLGACYLPQQQGAGAPTQPIEPSGQGPAPSEPGASAPGAAEQPAAPSGPKHASFTLRNTCSQTVKLFFGDKPKFGSGKSTTIGGNSQQNESMTEGDMIWIVDASDNGVTSYTVSANVREVAINSSCSGFETH